MENKQKTSYFEIISHNSFLEDFKVFGSRSGFNSLIFFLKHKFSKESLKICLKVVKKQKESNLIIEENILNILSLRKYSPKVIFSTNSSEGYEFLGLEFLKEIKNFYFTNEMVFLMIQLINSHQKLITPESVNSKKINDTFFSNINFEKKIKELVAEYRIIIDFDNFLSRVNRVLNDDFAMKNRSICTDRSLSNFVWETKSCVKMIDFSTVRIGGCFDNYIQLIDDPRLKLTRERKKFFYDHIVSQKTDTEYFLISAIYTNLLQAVFTRIKDVSLSNQYLKNVLFYINELN